MENGTSNRRQARRSVKAYCNWTCSTEAFIAVSSSRFCDDRLQGFFVQAQIGDQLAQPRVLIPQSLGFLRLAHVHATIFRLPGINRVRADSNFAGHILCLAPGFHLLDRRDHLCFCVLAPETKRHIKSMMYRLFELAMKRSWIEVQRNPMSLVHVKGRKRVIEKVVLTPDQMQIVRENLKEPYLLMAELACYLGLRICEVLGLKWKDYDPVAKSLSIQRSAVDGVVGEAKCEASRDVIPLSDNFAVLLKRWQKDAPPSEDGWMFPSVVTGRPYHAGILLRRHLQPLAKKVGVPQLGWHTFRHTFRSWLDAVGTAVGVQQRMMRHADVATTMNVYGKAMMDSKLTAHTKLLEYAGVRFCGVVNYPIDRYVVDSIGRGGGIRTPDPLLPNWIINGL